MGGGVPQGTYPHPRYLPPTPGQVWQGGTPRYLPPNQVWWGQGVPKGTYPLPKVPTPPDQVPMGRGDTLRYLPPLPPPAKDLLHGGRYASCVHAGGLPLFQWLETVHILGWNAWCLWQQDFLLAEWWTSWLVKRYSNQSISVKKCAQLK